MRRLRSGTRAVTRRPARDLHDIAVGVVALRRPGAYRSCDRAAMSTTGPRIRVTGMIAAGQSVG
jgi:hypothetical protein